MIWCLQHQNLLNLHGCCIEGDQLLLAYEYMETNSLEHALFVKNTRYFEHISRGHKAPKYVLWGYQTYKADVYSFGIVALEIVSGRNNKSYGPAEDCTCLLDWACKLQQEKKIMELVDPKLGSEYNREEAERMIRVSLLCTNASPSISKYFKIWK